MTNFERIATSFPAPATNEGVPYAITVSRVVTYAGDPDQAYATHMEITPVPGGVPYLVSGHYDMDLEEAKLDFQQRIKSNAALTKANKNRTIIFCERMD